MEGGGGGGLQLQTLRNKTVDAVHTYPLQLFATDRVFPGSGSLNYRLPISCSWRGGGGGE